MDVRRKIKEAAKSVAKHRIGDEFGTYKHLHRWYELLIEALALEQTRDFEGVVLSTLPRIFLIAERKDASESGRGFIEVPGGGLIETTVEPGRPVAYWTGTQFEFRPYPGALKIWNNSYFAFAQRVIDVLAEAGENATIIDLGSGVSALTFHIAYLARKAGIPLPRFVNIDREVGGLAIGAYLAELHGIQIDHVLMDLLTSLESEAHLTALRSRIPSGPRILVTRTGLSPSYFAGGALYRLFSYLVHGLDIQCGVHWEGADFRLDICRTVATCLGNPLPAETESFGALAFLDDNDDALGIDIVEYSPVWPHFPERGVPGFLRWARVGRPVI